jgi:hypothetical protein
MTEIQPRFFDTENKLIAHLEWEAIRILRFDGSHMNIADAYPKFEQRQFYWTQKYYDNATDEHHSIKHKITSNEYRSLDEFYAALKPILKPKPRGKMLKDKKKRTSQKEFQRDAKGEAFIDNDRLLSAAAKAAIDLSEALADEATVAATANQLASEYDDGTSLSEAQMSVLCDYIGQRIDKHHKLDSIEAALIDDPDKNLYYMWGQIKRRCLKGDTIAWPHATAVKHGRCSKSQVTGIMNKLVKLGAVTRPQEGKRGANSGRAAIYRREI